MPKLLPLALSLVLLPACQQLPAEHPGTPEPAGVLLLAHGGDEAWNQAVQAAVAPLRADWPLEVAFGMADPATIQEAVARLEASGIDRVAVVQLYVDGSSFGPQTCQILGIEPGLPPRPAAPAAAVHEAAGHHHGMEAWRIATDAAFTISMEGLLGSPEVSLILRDRVKALSLDPARESVLILAHGTGPEERNQAWLEAMALHRAAIDSVGPFRSVAFMTLREDWPEPRRASEQAIRRFVAAGAADAGRVLVIPYRVAGFGPYAEVLDGLAYVADERGFLPDERVTQWLRSQVQLCLKQEFRAQQL